MVKTIYFLLLISTCLIIEASDFSGMKIVKGYDGDFRKTTHDSLTYHYSNERLSPDFNAPLGGKTSREASITIFFDGKDEYLWSNSLTILDGKESKVSSMELKIRANTNGGQMIEFFLKKEYTVHSKLLLIIKKKANDEPSEILVLDIGSLNLKWVK